MSLNLSEFLQHEPLVCCKLYISEGRNLSVIREIESATKKYQVVIINKLVDKKYNRTNFTLLHSLLNIIPLEKAVIEMVNTAFQLINLENHEGTHPTLGVVDHICFHPLGASTLDMVAWLCKRITYSIACEFEEVPIYLYGAAHPEGKPLASIRRELGYFRRNKEGKPIDSIQLIEDLNTKIPPIKPDEGPMMINPKMGLITIGASPWVGTCNVPIHSGDIETVKLVAQKISEKGGGLKSVQAIGTVHGEGCCEVACYLLDPGNVGAAEVHTKVKEVCSDVGLDVAHVGEVYLTDYLPAEFLNRYFNRRIAAKL